MEGDALRHGNVALSGWDLSWDSFWTIDAPIYALGTLITGLDRVLLNVVPAIILVGVIVVGASVAQQGRKGIARTAAAGTVIVFLGLPNPNLAYFLLQGPWHVGTVLWCLIAFFLVAREDFTWRWAVAVMVLAAGLLGDLQMLFLGVSPVIGAGLVAMARRRNFRSGLATLAAGPAALVLAGIVREIASHLGSFDIATGVLRASSSQFPQNFGLLGSWGLGLLGVRQMTIGSGNSVGLAQMTGGSDPVRDLHVLIIAVLVAALLACIVTMGKGLVKGNQRDGSDDDASWRLNDLVLLGCVLDLVFFVFLNPNDNADNARYLTAGVVFAIVLVGRVSGSVVEMIGRHIWPALIVVSALVVVVGALDAAEDLSGSRAKVPAVALGQFLVAHRLSSGIGDYWSSSLVSVESDNAVAVRPVISNGSGRLLRYGRQSDKSWYSRHSFSFLVFDTARPWGGVDLVSATATFGPPTQVEHVGTYDVLTWSHRLRIAGAVTAGS